MSKNVVITAAIGTVAAICLFFYLNQIGDAGQSSDSLATTLDDTEESGEANRLDQMREDSSTESKNSAGLMAPASTGISRSELMVPESDHAQPMDPQNLERVKRQLEAHLEAGSGVSDYIAIQNGEERDEDWSPGIESMVDTFIRTNSNGLGRMQVAPTRCTRTVCVVAATGPSSEEGWSRIPLLLMNQPWFMETFSDSVNSSSSDSNGNIYLLFLVRK